jgi:hypothetical protein
MLMMLLCFTDATGPAVEKKMVRTSENLNRAPSEYIAGILSQEKSA